jgi:parallel beta-helix repeat protein
MEPLVGDRRATIILIMILCLIVVSFLIIGIVKTQRSLIFIRSDGSVEGTDRIEQTGNVYSFIDNINGSIIVETNDIVVDGAGYVLNLGLDNDFDAITVDGKCNVTIKDMVIAGSGSAIKFNQAINCMVVNNTILVNETGLLLKNSKGINILQNSIEALWGIFLDDSLDNVISENIISKTVLWGTRFINSSNNIFTQNNVIANETAAPVLTVIEIDDHSSGNTVEGNIVTGTRNLTEISTITGISVRYSDNNILSNNTITCNNFGLYIQGCAGNEISSNKIYNNKLGTSLADSPNNIFRYNLLENNENHFRVQGDYLSQLINDIDTSNTADGKPIYYLVNMHDVTVSSDAGYVALVNCTGVTVDNLDLSGSGQGIMLGFTKNSTVRNNNLSNNHDGVWVVSSCNNVISGNHITNTEFGIAFINYGNKIDSANNLIAYNIIDSNSRGIWLSRNNNTFVGNTFINNVAAVWISGSSNNLFYCNNFVNNTDDVFDLSYGVLFLGSSSHNFWDNGTLGNYWNDYNAIDNNNDGIADIKYVLYEDNVDNYPLIEEYPQKEPIAPKDDGDKLLPIDKFIKQFGVIIALALLAVIIVTLSLYWCYTKKKRNNEEKVNDQK